MGQIELLISNYGYIAIIIGNFLEGETFLILGGLFAYSQILNIYLVILVAFCVAFGFDQLLFHIGRRYGYKLLKKYKFLNNKFKKLNGFLTKHENLLIMSFRFIYGTRIIAPLSLGMNNVDPKKFLILDFLSALIWSTIYGSLGFLLGGTLNHLIGDLKGIQIEISVAIIAIFSIIGIGRYFQNKHNLKYKAFGGKKI